MKRIFGYSICAVALALLGCSGDAATQSGGTGASGGGVLGGGGAGGSNELPPAICKSPGSKWDPSKQAFRDATSDWGLDIVGAMGVRLSAVDFDGDGWPDLVVRLGGNGSDDFSAGGVRQTWLLRNTHDKHFEDVTESSGIRQTRAGTDPNIGRPGEVFAFGDVNNDGSLDVFTGITQDPANPGAETSELLLNDGTGKFTLGDPSNPFRMLSPNLDAVAGLSFVDFDRDGNLDLWVVENTINDLPLVDHLYKGDGQGHFTDVTASLGLTTIGWDVASVDELNTALGSSIGWSAVACDLNGDGNPELLAGSYGRAPNMLWQSLGQGLMYRNQSIASGYAFDGDQDWSDNQSAMCWCHLHPTDMGCMGVPPPTEIACATDADAFRWDNTYDQNPFRLGGNSAATECVDVDNDGKLDLLTGEIAHWDVGQSSDKAELMINTSGADVTFTRPGNDVTGLSRTFPVPDWNEGMMTASVFDFDNDGWPDVYYGNSDYPYNHGLLYHQDAKGHFEAVPIPMGIDQHRSHGSAVADFDHDGDLDIVVGHSFARCNEDPNDDSECYPTQQIRFFENVIGDQGNFVNILLTGGPQTNRAAIGARVSVKAGDVTQTQEVGGGHGHYGAQDDLSLHFGLGDACEAEVTIRWPDAALTTQTFTLPSGYRFSVTQGDPPQVMTDD
jgi:hypothetical protein